jgi:hypothetical protein
MAVLPKFAMLTHLDLGSVSSKVLLGLLQKSPVLNTLVFKVGNYFFIILQHLIYIFSYSNFVGLFNHQGILKFNQELLNSAVVPDCLTFTLKVVKFGIVHGYKHELFLAKYFMENGVVLERMSFYLANPWQSDSNDMVIHPLV